MINPWMILGFVIALATTNIGSYFYGIDIGKDKQKVADQTVIDKTKAWAQSIIDGYNTKIAQQTSEANKLLQEGAEKVIALQVEREKFKNQLGEQREINRQTTNKLADAYAAYSLRFSVTEVARCWRGGKYTEGAECNAASPTKTATIQLPDALAAELRQIAKDADDLNDDYKQCYAWAQGIGLLEINP